MAILSFKEIECMDCYKCVRHCPVKSITVKNGRAQILESECILCGTCTVVFVLKMQRRTVMIFLKY